jgi:hypothetical protein
MSDPAGLVIELPQLKRIESMLLAVLEERPAQAWYTLEQAWRVKYGSSPKGVSLQTLRNCLALQPKGGLPDGWQSGRKAWTGPTVAEWCLVDDIHLGAYLDRVCPGRRVPTRIQTAVEKHLKEYPSLAKEPV